MGFFTFWLPFTVNMCMNWIIPYYIFPEFSGGLECYCSTAYKVCRCLSLYKPILLVKAIYNSGMKFKNLTTICHMSVEMMNLIFVVGNTYDSAEPKFSMVWGLGHLCLKCVDGLNLVFLMAGIYCKRLIWCSLCIYEHYLTLLGEIVSAAKTAGSSVCWWWL